MEISLEYNFLSLIGYKYEKDEEYSNKVTPLKLEIVNFTQCNDEQKAILKELETCIKNILAIDTKINRTTTSLTNETDEEYSNRAELEYLKKCNEDRKATIKEVDACIYNVRAAHSDYIHHINNKHFS
ncbi:MAG: hypothetical protein E6R13_05785 [Spirochaetes bacterium]|nr:MAG: hypothetical protein E6R13_05785 [Spirochaetota bacterium]